MTSPKKNKSSHGNAKHWFCVDCYRSLLSVGAAVPVLVPRPNYMMAGTYHIWNGTSGRREFDLHAPKKLDLAKIHWLFVEAYSPEPSVMSWTDGDGVEHSSHFTSDGLLRPFGLPGDNSSFRTG